MHRFCEDHRIPCIFPVTDFPVISDTDWYTLYFSKGLYQEGEAAARALLRREVEPAPETAIVQVYRDTREGRALAAGFQETWRELGMQPPVNVVLDKEEAITEELLRRQTAGKKRVILLLWAGPDVFPALEAVAAGPARPGTVFVSSSLLKQDFWKLPDKARDFTYMTYPFRLPKEEGLFANTAKLAGDRRPRSTTAGYRPGCIRS